MGPTASGKTSVAMRLAAELPVDVVSVDSALVYRGMDIGTAKPDADMLAKVPHQLINICEPEETYSAGTFVQDAVAAIESIHAAGRIPLLAGGTMMYFRALTQGIAPLPAADANIRAALDAEAQLEGWPALHQQLAAVDADAAARIAESDSQRIQRALEVFRITGKPLSELQRETLQPARYNFIRVALMPPDRAILHQRIAERLDQMMDAGFLDEVRQLRTRPGLTADSTSMRSVGYRQLWAHLEGETDLPTAAERALFATRQLAKRQITWLRSEPVINCFDPLEAGAIDTILSVLRENLGE
ncbi:tRNA (adenosine(37)-N6)-dimethylallyltransferase MiaA [Woeseia oceani]|uniref:tRNA dimethylallyltransferase n=1 Tax=Woeseia oceani TaxID=1548547 RepID=A0A193LGP9_9GAMM|nr:tRNA (adenosine(37)-N6)-dimethylallyltransferase MiaA [Woeseia oceani]